MLGRMGARIGTILLAAGLTACSTLPRFHRARPEPQTVRRTPIAKALDYVLQTQWTPERVLRADRPWVGNWPQVVDLEGFPARVTDISSGPPAFVHYGLCHVNESTAARLGLTGRDVERARSARKLTARFLREFQEPPGTLHAAFGWWPRIRHAPTPLRSVMGGLMVASVGGPRMHGTRVSPSNPSMPRSLWLLPDNDDTAYIHMALEMDRTLDGGPGPPAGLGPLLSRWRDDETARRRFPCWLPRGSGAFLTYFDTPGQRTFHNDIDLIALANCVWALAALGQTDTPGYAESVRVIDDAIRAGRHRCHLQTTIYYTSPFALHGLVARAYAQGPIPELAHAVQILADDVEARACNAQWAPRCTAASNATNAIYTLVAAGRHGPLLQAACRQLIRLQDPRTGAFPDEPIAFGHTSHQQLSTWRCRAAVTATAMSALIQAQLGSPAIR